jgi:hypothetical protein
MAKIRHTQDHWFKVVFWDERRETQNSKSYGSIYPLTLNPRWRSRVQFPRNQFGTDLKQIESLSWTIPWSLASFLVLQIRSSPFSTVFLGPNQLIFSPKQVPCRFSLNLPHLGLGPLSKGLGTKLKLSTNKIAWIHWSLDLGPSSKVTLKHGLMDPKP